MPDEDSTLTRLLRQTRQERNRCTCGSPGTVYAADEVTPLCGKCWMAIYQPSIDIRGIAGEGKP